LKALEERERDEYSACTRRGQTARITINASEINSPRSESDYANNEAPRATGNYLCKYTVATGAFYPLCTRSRAARRGDEKLAGAFIAEDTRLTDRHRSTAPTERVPVKSVKAVDGVAEIRWVIALRVMYVEPASCPHARAHTHSYEIHSNETRSNAPSCDQLTCDKGKKDLCSRIR